MPSKNDAGRPANAFNGLKQTPEFAIERVDANAGVIATGYSDGALPTRAKLSAEQCAVIARIPAVRRGDRRRVSSTSNVCIRQMMSLLSLRRRRSSVCGEQGPAIPTHVGGHARGKTN